MNLSDRYVVGRHYHVSVFVHHFLIFAAVLGTLDCNVGLQLRGDVEAWSFLSSARGAFRCGISDTLSLLSEVVYFVFQFGHWRGRRWCSLRL